MLYKGLERNDFRLSVENKIVTFDEMEFLNWRSNDCCTMEESN